MTVYNLSAAGLVKAAQDAINNGTLKIAKFEFDAGIEANRAIGAHGTGVILPTGAIVVGGFFNVNTKFTSASTNTGTIAISVEGANDIQTAAAVSGAPYSTTGGKQLFQKSTLLSLPALLSPKIVRSLVQWLLLL